MTSQADIAGVLARHPALGEFGWDSAPITPSADFLNQVRRAFFWIKTAPNADKLITHRGSYFLKHAAERHARSYVGNAALIAAAALAGYRPVRSAKYPSLNCRFSHV